MDVFFEHPRARLLLGDARDALASLDASSFDSCVCDPPYGLSAAPDIVEVLTCWLAGQSYEHHKPGFMGKEWDSFTLGPEYWRELYRVLKPGAHALIFSGSRTVDLQMIALRLAGFEIRDTILWLYGTGFPKSMDVSKAIDKVAGAEREVIAEVPSGVAIIMTPGGSLKDAMIVQHNTNQASAKLLLQPPRTPPSGPVGAPP